MTEPVPEREREKSPRTRGGWHTADPRDPREEGRRVLDSWRMTHRRPTSSRKLGESRTRGGWHIARSTSSRGRRIPDSWRMTHRTIHEIQKKKVRRAPDSWRMTHRTIHEFQESSGRSGSRKYSVGVDHQPTQASTRMGTLLHVSSTGVHLGTELDPARKYSLGTEEDCGFQWNWFPKLVRPGDSPGYS